MKIKLNLPLLQLIIRLLILLILFVILFMISAFLYTGKYWPDVYNYINANITIKRIPSISELNLTILTIYETEYTTESYSTTEDYTDMTTDEDFTDSLEDFFPDRRKREIKIEEINKDYIELPKNVIITYVFDEDTTTETMRDLVDEAKLVTKDMKDVEMVTEIAGKGKEFEDMSNPNDTSIAETFPWVATIFIKNGSNNQFDYFCDGAILSQNVILTAARCVNPSNTKVEVENVIIILGKTSLQTSGDGERVHRVKQIKTHDNFTISGSEAANDLAVLELEEPITFSSTILPARIEGDVLGEVGEAFTTGWAISGNLTAIHFDKEKTQSCVKNTVSENVFCATYDYDVATCPNHGGLYILRLGDQWSLQGIRTGDTTDRSFCIDKTVLYTALSGYTRWVTDKINENKAV